MDKILKSPFILAAISGLLMGLSFPPVPMFFFAWVGLIPLFQSFDALENWKKAVRTFYIFFFVYHGATNWWISSFQKDTDPWLMVAGFAIWIAHPFFFMPQLFLLRSIGRRGGNALMVLSFPFIWTFFEWTHSLTELSYPWQAFGYTQTYFTSLSQTADLVGVWGLTFIVCALNSTFYFLFLAIRKHRRENSSTRTIFFAVSPLLFLAIALILLPSFYGLARIRHFDSLSKTAVSSMTTSVRAAIVQPNINPWVKWASNPLDQVVLQKRLQDSITKLDTNIELAVWSETAMPILGLAPNNLSRFQFLRQWIDTTGVSIVSGFSEQTSYEKRNAPRTAKQIRGDPNAFYDTYNSVVVLSPLDSLEPQVHRKMRMTPFAERVPFAESLSFLKESIEWGVGLTGWTLGETQKPLIIPRKNGDRDRPAIRLGCIICIESIYPEFVRAYSKNSNVLCVVTNDAWYDHTFGPEQHWVIARMRAIENRRAIIRCGNSGISGFIGLAGEEMKRLPACEQVAGSASVPLCNEQSMYALNGDWLPVICGLSVLGFVIFVFVSKKRRMD